MENLLKNKETIRTNLEQYTLEIMKILRTLNLGSTFTGSYKKKSVLHPKETKLTLKNIYHHTGNK